LRKGVKGAGGATGCGAGWAGMDLSNLRHEFSGVRGWVVRALLGWLGWVGVWAQAAMPGVHRVSTPVRDEVFLQEVGRKVVWNEGLTSVAVRDGHV